ncbi:MAG: putative lipid II flippase FtsW [Clostridiales Family XIII bacterium]|jgi:cell division protein FtsW|nr:putative lipid II flippase FtsW [Clostridiales Family XIII bacterium]
MPEKCKPTNTGDFLFAILVLALVVFGVVMVFSAGSYMAMVEYGDPYYYLKRSGMWAGAGLVAMLVALFIPYRFYFYLSPPIMLGSVLLLGLLFTPLAVIRNDAARWLGVGEFTVMPGEIAKVAVILFVAWYLSAKPDRIRSFLRGPLPLLAVGALCFFMIVKQPNLSTAIIVFGLIAAMIFVAGIKWGHFAILLAGAGAAFASLFLYLRETDPDGYQMRRITSFVDPFKYLDGAGWQAVQSLLAFGAGGVFGNGLGKSIQKAMYLPEGHNDFILAVIGEELGLFGCLVLLVVYLLLIYRGARIAIHAPDRFSMLIAAGVTILFAMQVIMNVAVVTSIMPNTGVALPFVSYGGNALLLYMFLAGLVLNISRYTKEVKAA